VARLLLTISALGLALASALPASGSDIGTVKCSPNSDRVWVYESLNSFDVETRLKCGDTVEILSRVKGYVKIRTASGTEGYVPDAAFPDLPALPPDDSDKPVASIVAAARPVANTAARSTAMPPATSPSAPLNIVPAAPPSDEPKPTTVSANSGVAPSNSASAPPKSAAAIARPSPAPVAATNPAVERSSSPAAIDMKPASAAVATPPQPQRRAKSSMPTAVAEPPAPKKAPAKPAPSTTQSAKATPNVAPNQTSPSAGAMVSAKASVSAAPMNASMVDTSAKVSPAADIIIHEPARDPDLEEYPDAKPENESADPACRIFFSAYGLNPDQYKWLVENRRKQYSAICPAPDLSRVDYVILFAHDSDTFNSAMPSPVHTDRSGFSDFSPLTTADTALISVSELDKARYEFVWVFHTKRGTFDPTKFSARRRPLFTTDAKGSHAGPRAVEDAFHFIEGQGSPDR
jgi:hypothetical protein